MSRNRVRLNICGCECVIGSDDSESYVRSLGEQVEKAIEDITGKNERVSITMAAIITALRFCDEAQKAAGGADNLRSQIKDYLEDASHARMEAEEAKREVERLKQEIQTLRGRLAENKGHEKDKPHEEPRVQKPIAVGAPVQKPQAGSYSRVQEGTTAEQEDFINFFEKKNDEL
ncbi:cell division protein ZapA [Caproiciproducens galactitolivorans]|uniref:Cell division protein ZapA n=1 Tax=Caproiciproducens galactitolivorans TaxID=642589 RepID=A0A4Z0XZG1_9FIRM|nr:cell division protein ZapA [Caproiciproducens galactitolivorans]QEY35302.1 cell division protein ZapA [Caproiciproducens galactitolivorans]TGJ76999.1 cell division protein ZapA [Caproiciproducens galactitolivorans]